MDILGFISFLLLALIAAQRLFPTNCNGNMQKTSLAISLVFLCSRSLFTLFLPPSDTLCSSSLVAASSDTNWRCAVQGTFMMFGAYAAALLCSVRSYEVFAVVVFGSHWLRGWKWCVVWNGVCWGVPLVVSLAAVGTGSIGFIATRFCGPRFNLQEGLILYPLIGLSIPALIAEVWFLTRCVIVCVQARGREVLTGRFFEGRERGVRARRRGLQKRIL